MSSKLFGRFPPAFREKAQLRRILQPLWKRRSRGEFGGGCGIPCSLRDCEIFVLALLYGNAARRAKALRITCAVKSAIASSSSSAAQRALAASLAQASEPPVTRQRKSIST